MPTALGLASAGEAAAFVVAGLTWAPLGDSPLTMLASVVGVLAAPVTALTAAVLALRGRDRGPLTRQAPQPAVSRPSPPVPPGASPTQARTPSMYEGPGYW